MSRGIQNQNSKRDKEGLEGHFFLILKLLKKQFEREFKLDQLMTVFQE